MKKIRNKLMAAVSILAVFTALSMGYAYAGLDDSIERFFDPKPIPIDLYHNPASVSGTYKIDRIVIKEGEEVILDSNKDYAVTDDKGEMAIDLNIAAQTISMNFKMQMSGPVFTKGSALARYSFIYENKTIAFDTATKKTWEEKLAALGLHVYSHDTAVWEIPFESSKTLVLILEKENDKIKKLSKSKYLFL